ncbi:MAG: hypothetical protein H7841_06855 [Magnetospirillum sp. WYHS-4]
MQQFIVCFDLAGKKPSVSEVEHRIDALKAAGTAKLLDRVWLIKSRMSGEQIYEHLNSVMGTADRLLVAESPSGTYRDLLTATPQVRKLWI